MYIILSYVLAKKVKFAILDIDNKKKKSLNLFKMYLDMELHLNNKDILLYPWGHKTTDQSPNNSYNDKQLLQTYDKTFLIICQLFIFYHNVHKLLSGS